MSDPLLQITGLSITSEDKILVNDLSLTIRPGTTMGLVGESGSGKTLTALSTLRLLPPGIKISSGMALLRHGTGSSTDLYSLSGEAINTFRGKEIAMIFQEPMTSLNPSLRCGYQVEEGMLLHLGCSRPEARQKVLEIFREVKLPDPAGIYDSWPHQLSGGQRQRVMIAMALAMNPSLLIADEPTTALDVTVQKKILLLLRELQDKHGLSILFISHDLMVVRQIAHEITVMYNGEVMEQGNVKDVFSSPASPYTKGLLACKPGLDELPERLPTIADFLSGKDRAPARKQQTPRQQEEEPVLEIKNLSTYFSNPGRRRAPVKAVDEVSFRLYTGETLGLVGESGCGKTTLGRTILRLIRSSSGEVYYKGIPLSGLSERQLRLFRKKMQIVFQDPYSSLNPRMTIGRILTEPMLIHGVGRSGADRQDKAASLLARVGLSPDDLNRYPHQFSGGQRQRIGIARALATEPEFIILDESVSALDVSVQAQVLNLLNDLKDDLGLTYIFISHDLSVVRYMSDRIMVMQSGRMVEAGETGQVFSHPQEVYTRDLLDSIPR